MGTVALWLLAAVCGSGAWLDLRSRRLPNWLCLAAWLLGVAQMAMIGTGPEVASALAHSVLALVTGMLVFRAGFIGGGDAKFYAGLAVWMPLSKAVPFLLATSLAGLVLVLAMFARRAIPGFGSETLRRGVPYGVAIAAGALVTFAGAAGF